MKLSIGKNREGALVVIDNDATTNSHIFATGTSGSGKSYFLGGLVDQAVAQGASVVVFDVSRDWQQRLSAQGEGLMPGSIRVIDVRGMGVSFNPLLPQCRMDGTLETPSDIGLRVSGLIGNAYRLREESVLYLANAVTAFACMTGYRPYSLTGLVYFILDTPELLKQTKVSVSRLINLSNIINCGEGQTHWNITSPGLTIVNFGGLADERHQALITELMVEEFWNQRVQWGTAGGMPLILVCDEAQKFRFGNGSALVRVLREGRKFGMAGWFASQYIDDGLAAQALDLAALRPVFRPAPRQVKKMAELLGGYSQAERNNTINKLTCLQRGEYLVQDVNGTIRHLFV